MDLTNFSQSSYFIITLIFLIICKGTSAATFTVINKCSHTVWPGILSNADSARLDSTGFELPPGGSRSFQSPPNWSGRFWGRTGCTFDPATGQGSCASGDCGSKQVECNGAGASPPATLAEFTIRLGGLDFYDVSLVDGYNLPVLVDASRGSGACLSTGCVTDLNQQCPPELRVGNGEACRSACEAFGRPEYCCSGEYGSPGACKPTVYSEMFKAACPKSYSYAYDDPTSTFTCSGADYTITFCPSSTSQKSARDTSPTSTSSTTSGSDSATEGSSTTGTGDFPFGYNSSWLPNFVTGDSSRVFSSSALQATLTLISINLLVYFSLIFC
ncbi:thaumatin-like protein 1 [Morus notabilis]|uniref:thaumatin-like protein 1 n=1 Tax=Morus notabilis TaxID=981085 RepID=UPI000CECFE5E|nr:thaumatin-like protein 1 [Morus notabilis]